MDPLTQGLLGACVATAVCPRHAPVRSAAVFGALAGMAPDLDVLISSSTDPLLGLEYHRHFTHALAFIPFGGTIMALFFWFVLRMRQHSFRWVWVFATLGWATHGLLDACTSYGTRLYWPFSDTRVAWSSISIIDPIYTLTLLVCVLICVISRSPKAARTGFLLSSLYLCFGFWQHYQVEAALRKQAAAAGHTVDAVYSSPTIGNLLVWRSLYRSGDVYYVNGAYKTPLGAVELYPGAVVDAISADDVFSDLPDDSTQRADIQRFAYFSSGFIYQHPSDPYVIADLRYSALPTDARGFWGVRVNPSTPNAHVEYVSLRNIEGRDWRTLRAMIISGDFPETVTHTHP